MIMMNDICQPHWLFCCNFGFRLRVSISSSDLQYQFHLRFIAHSVSYAYRPPGFRPPVPLWAPLARTSESEFEFSVILEISPYVMAWRHSLLSATSTTQSSVREHPSLIYRKHFLLILESRG